LKEVEEFIADGMDRVGWSPRTAEAYRSHLGALVVFATARLGRVPEPADIDGDVLQRHDTARARSGGKQRSRAAMLACYFSFAKWLCRAGKISKDQMSAVLECPRVRVNEKPKRKYATGQQVRMMLAACPRVEDLHSERLAYRARLAAAVISLLVYTGARRSSVCSLNLLDVNLTSTPPTVTMLCKGGKRLTLPLHRNAVTALRAWIDRRPTDSPRLFAVPVRTRRVEDVVTPLSPMRLIGLLREVRALAEIEDESVTLPHAFRRFAASALLRSGASLKVVSEFLGHSSIRITEQYLGVEDGEMAESIERLDFTPKDSHSREHKRFRIVRRIPR